MKKSISVFGYAFIIAGAVLMASIASGAMTPAAAGHACFFEHADYQGRWFCARSGTHRLSLVDSGWNDVISSIYVSPGTSIMVCEHVDFDGRCATLSSSTSFVGYRWNDRISSFAVE